MPLQQSWRHVKIAMIAETNKVKNAFTAADLLRKGDGTYTIVVAADGSKVKAFSLRVENGHFVKHTRNDLSYSPHRHFISPRLIDISHGDTGRSYMVDATWLEVAH